MSADRRIREAIGDLVIQLQFAQARVEELEAALAKLAKPNEEETQKTNGRNAQPNIVADNLK